MTLVADQQREGAHLKGIELLEGELLASIHNGAYHNVQPISRSCNSCLPISKKGLKWARPSSSEPFQKRTNRAIGYDISGPNEFEQSYVRHVHYPRGPLSERRRRLLCRKTRRPSNFLVPKLPWESLEAGTQ